jgi:Cu/Ag efflux protein CusF
MKKAVSVVISFFLIISVVGISFAKEKPKVINRTGEVVAIDVAAKSLTLKSLKYKENIVITINENTLVKMNKEKKSLADVKVGDTVTVWFFEKDKTAKSIEIKTAKTEQKEEKKGAEPAKPPKK